MASDSVNKIDMGLDDIIRLSGRRGAGRNQRLNKNQPSGNNAKPGIKFTPANKFKKFGNQQQRKVNQTYSRRRAVQSQNRPIQGQGRANQGANPRSVNKQPQQQKRQFSKAHLALNKGRGGTLQNSSSRLQTSRVQRARQALWSTARANQGRNRQLQLNRARGLQTQTAKVEVQTRQKINRTGFGVMRSDIVAKELELKNRQQTQLHQSNVMRSLKRTSSQASRRRQWRSKPPVARSAEDSSNITVEVKNENAMRSAPEGTRLASVLMRQTGLYSEGFQPSATRVKAVAQEQSGGQRESVLTQIQSLQSQLERLKRIAEQNGNSVVGGQFRRRNKQAKQQRFSQPKLTRQNLGASQRMVMW